MAHDDLFKEHYFFELSRRDGLNQSLAFPAGLVTLLGGAVFAMLGKLSLPLDGWDCWLALACLLCGGCLVISTYHLIRMYWGYQYKAMPLLSALHTYYQQLVDYYLKTGQTQPQAEQLAKQKFGADLDAAYADNSRVNGLNNDRRAAYLFTANGFIIAAIALALIATPAFAIVSMQPQTEKPQRIEIVNLKELTPCPTHKSPAASHPSNANPSPNR